MANAGDTPVRVFSKTRDRVRIGAAYFGMTQAEFFDAAVISFFNQNAVAVEEVQNRLTQEEVEAVPTDPLVLIH